MTSVIYRCSRAANSRWPERLDPANPGDGGLRPLQPGADHKAQEGINLNRLVSESGPEAEALLRLRFMSSLSERRRQPQEGDDSVALLSAQFSRRWPRPQGSGRVGVGRLVM